MDEALQMYEYFLIRVAPDPMRAEFVNVGVALYHRDGGFADVRMNPDWRRVQRLAPGFEEEDLAGLEQHLRGELQHPDAARRNYLLHLAGDAFSHGLQFTAPTGVLTADPAAELDELYRRYARPVEATAAERAPNERERILSHLRDAFAAQGVLGRMRQRVALRELAPAAAADSFRFDFYYRPNGVHKAVQAVPLGDDEGRVKALCFTVRDFHERHAAAGDLRLTAIVNEGPDDEDRTYQQELLRGAGVSCRRLAEAPALAAEIRAELQLS